MKILVTETAGFIGFHVANVLLERGDIVYGIIGDIIAGVIAACDSVPSKNEEKPFCRLFNIGNSKLVKLMDFIQTLEKALGKEVIKEMYPMQAGDVKQTYADVNELKGTCGYDPRMKLKDEVEEFVTWYKAFC